MPIMSCHVVEYTFMPSNVTTRLPLPSLWNFLWTSSFTCVLNLTSLSLQKSRNSYSSTFNPIQWLTYKWTYQSSRIPHPPSKHTFNPHQENHKWIEYIIKLWSLYLHEGVIQAMILPCITSSFHKYYLAFIFFSLNNNNLPLSTSEQSSKIL